MVATSSSANRSLPLQQGMGPYMCADAPGTRPPRADERPTQSATPDLTEDHAKLLDEPVELGALDDQRRRDPNHLRVRILRQHAALE
jgi:hypothetical protein